MSSEVNELKEQVIDLQSQLSFQEDAIKGLDDALAQQQQELLVLRRQLELLHEQVRQQPDAREGGQALSPPDEKPPHY